MLAVIVAAAAVLGDSATGACVVDSSRSCEIFLDDNNNGKLQPDSLGPPTCSGALAPTGCDTVSTSCANYFQFDDHFEPAFGSNNFASFAKYCKDPPPPPAPPPSPPTEAPAPPAPPAALSSGAIGGIVVGAYLGVAGAAGAVGAYRTAA